MTATKLLEQFNENGIHPDKLYKSKGLFVAKWGFFYSHRQSSTKKAKLLTDKYGAEVEIINAYDDWNAWPKDSYFIVKFKWNG